MERNGEKGAKILHPFDQWPYKVYFVHETGWICSLAFLFLFYSFLPCRYIERERENIFYGLPFYYPESLTLLWRHWWPRVTDVTWTKRDVLTHKLLCTGSAPLDDHHWRDLTLFSLSSEWSSEADADDVCLFTCMWVVFSLLPALVYSIACLRKWQVYLIYAVSCLFTCRKRKKKGEKERGRNKGGKNGERDGSSISHSVLLVMASLGKKRKERMVKRGSKWNGPCESRAGVKSNE